MKSKSISTRRRFFLQASAAMTVPLAASTARAAERSVDDGALQARLAALEDVNAIRELQRAYAQLVNSGAHAEIPRLFADPAAALVDDRVRGLSADGFGEHDGIEVAADRQTATARIHCTVATETAIGPSCTLVEMARVQGEGVLRRAERRVLAGAYVKQGGAWKIARLMWEQGRG